MVLVSSSSSVPLVVGWQNFPGLMFFLVVEVWFSPKRYCCVRGFRELRS